MTLSDLHESFEEEEQEEKNVFTHLQVAASS